MVFPTPEGPIKSNEEDGTLSLTNLLEPGKISMEFMVFHIEIDHIHKFCLQDTIPY